MDQTTLQRHQAVLLTSDEDLLSRIGGTTDYNYLAFEAKSEFELLDQIRGQAVAHNASVAYIAGGIDRKISLFRRKVTFRAQAYFYK